VTDSWISEGVPENLLEDFRTVAQNLQDAYMQVSLSAVLIRKEARDLLKSYQNQSRHVPEEWLDSIPISRGIPDP